MAGINAGYPQYNPYGSPSGFVTPTGAGGVSGPCSSSGNFADDKAQNYPKSDPSANYTQGTYTVKSGDTLWKIARNSLPKGATASQIAKKVQEIASRSGIANPDRIYPGQLIIL